MRTNGFVGMTAPIVNLLYLTDQIMAQELPLSHPHMARLKAPNRIHDMLRSCNINQLMEGMLDLYPECPEWAVFIRDLISDHRRNKNRSTLRVMFTERLIPTHGKGLHAQLSYPRRCRMLIQGLLYMYDLPEMCEDTLV